MINKGSERGPAGFVSHDKLPGFPQHTSAIKSGMMSCKFKGQRGNEEEITMDYETILHYQVSIS